jgi:D-alanyl-D-alanine carboxypeptidase/D-alanyl-D-alanine-endopeptidase (penicillin-binding protein 4)
MDRIRNKIFLNAFNSFILFSIIIFPSKNYSQNNYDNLKIRIDSLFTTDFFQSSQIAIDVFDLSADQKVYSKNEKLLFHPASVQKIFTASAALKFLGSDFNFKTGVYYTGEIDDSVCDGDVFIVGGFDPDFNQKDLELVATKIKDYGIKEIKGNLYADVSAGDSIFWGSGWMWDDDPGSFAAYISPLSINGNSIKIICSPSEIGKSIEAKIIPQNNFLKIENNSTAIDSGASTLNVTRDWLNRSNRILISGQMPKTSAADTVELNIFNPVFYFLNLAKEEFNRQGIILRGNIDTLSLKKDADEIFTLERNIDSVITFTNKTSYNLGAEMILRAIGSEFFGKHISAKQGILFVDSLISLAGFDPKNYRIVDGSGLSFYNLISAELSTGFLKYLFFEEEDLFVRIYNSFPIAGFDGTLKKRFIDSPAQKRVRAKTGTLSGVSNLAGYLHSKSGATIAFTIFIQNFVGSSSQARLIQNKICELLFEEL